MHRAVSSAALGAVGAGNRQLQRREELVDVLDFAAGDDGKGAVELAGGALELVGQGRGNLNGIRGGRDLNEGAVEVGKDGEALGRMGC
ncbi:MAG: hypothetical protein K0R85_1951 [Devosia sp.]|nr:hypothetical protein [Devosia sp.]